MSGDLNEHELFSGYQDLGLKVLDGQPADAGLKLAAILHTEEAYQDPKHRGHEVVMRDIRTIYERANPEPEPIPAYYRDQAAQRAQALLQNPAYLDKMHKDHTRVVAEAKQAYELANRPVAER